VRKRSFLTLGFFALCTALLLIGCTSGGRRSFPTVSMCVFSDPHYYDPNLGTSGTAFEDHVRLSRKLTAESEAILESLIELVVSEDAEIVLVPGDLTKDGERTGHLKCAAYLGQLEAAGKRVFVIPGNHDIDNPHAVQYSGDTTIPVESITAEEFAEIYRDFGYGEALFNDPHSLSYVAEPIDGFWILAMDSCLYRNNAEYPVTGGEFSEETLSWLLEILEEGCVRNKTVFGMMHHGLLEHFTGQKLYFPDYVVEDSMSLSHAFARSGLNVVFTGHFHAQDVVGMTFPDGTFMLDIETGSPVTYPCPYRAVSLDSSGELRITSRRISSIDYETGGKLFQQYALDFLEDDLDETMASMLEEIKWISPAVAQEVSPHMASAMIAHYAGDESPSNDTLDYIRQLQESDSFVEQMLGAGLLAIWTDPEPEDNVLTVDLLNPF
jgi:hypothetical protein